MRGGIVSWMTVMGVILIVPLAAQKEAGLTVFNVRDYGATGIKEDNARSSIQEAIDACDKLGGGMVYLPPGSYTSGTLHLRSHVRLFLEAGATLYSSKNRADYDKESLLYGEDLEGISIEGRGVIDGQGAYEWRENDHDDAYIKDNELLQKAAGSPMIRSFPTKDSFGKLILLIRCRDVRIAGLSLLRSPSWTIHPYGCERMVIDGVTIRTPLEGGVWADGIDPDGCRDLRIANCTIETGDDALVFYSMNWYGPALPCENITVTNCRLSSASSAIKFCDGNMNCVRRVTISNCVITGSNRGIAFMVFDGGTVSDVVLSGLTIECVRHDWFWWGDGDPIHFNIKRRSEVSGQTPKPDEPAAGAIRNIIIRDVIARGRGSSIASGHPQSWLENITFDNVRLIVGDEPERPVQKAEHGLKFRWVRNLKLRDVEVAWDDPRLERWRSALYLEDVDGAEIVAFSGRQARPGVAAAAIGCSRAGNIILRQCRAQQGTGIFLDVEESAAGGLYLLDSDLRQAQLAFRLGKGVKPADFQFLNNLVH